MMYSWLTKIVYAVLSSEEAQRAEAPTQLLDGGKAKNQLPRPEMGSYAFDSFRFQKVPAINDQDLCLNTLVEPHILCAKCQPIRAWLESSCIITSSKDRDPLTRVFRHYSTRDEFKRSYMKGCHLCTLIIANNQARRERFEFGQPWEDFKVTVTYFGRREETAKRDKDFLLVSGKNEGEVKEVLKLPLSYESDVTMELQSDDASCALSTISSATQDLTRAWLNECMTTHKACNVIQSGRGPTRLLDLGTRECVSIKLVMTASLDSCPVYTALSYCWGGKGNFKLLQSNIQEFLKGISISQLPQTIQDAIKTTRSFNFRYIWVDSLCIIQDSKEDWSQEAVTMGDVYGNCVLSIAALGAKNCDEGLFSHRDPLLSKPCRLSKHPVEGQMFVYPREWNQSVHYDPWSSSPLNRRGWVLQERLLPPRTLNFGWGVIWNCREKVLYEYKQRPLDQHSAAHIKKLFWDLVSERSIATGLLNVKDTYMLLALWWDIVATYSRAWLTVPTDKDIAFSGVTEAFKNRTGWKYLAGLWEPFLFDELLWFRPTEAGYEYHVHENQPTWSWLKIDQGVRHQYYKDPVPITILAAAKVVNRATVSAVLEIRFRLKIEFLAGVFDDDTTDAQMGYVSHLGKVHRCVYYPETQYDCAETLEWIPFKYYEGGSTAARNRYYGLVVAPVPGAKGTYKRVGFASVWIDKDDPTIFSFPPIKNEASPSRNPAGGVDFNGLSDSARQYFNSRYLSPDVTDSWESLFLI
ncbi:hypothetical protein EG329_011911 [Mollisiaceae sp. DMI_Dod_QoI]|nr:hypothetical protein EG329_011911 [Helotiales sp. DMI_Dod_QoI]